MFLRLSSKGNVCLFLTQPCMDNIEEHGLVALDEDGKSHICQMKPDHVELLLGREIAEGEVIELVEKK